MPLNNLFVLLIRHRRRINNVFVIISYNYKYNNKSLIEFMLEINSIDLLLNINRSID